jgi:pyridoxal phosphate enzyme (YggS family)
MLNEILDNLKPYNARLVAISKTKSKDDILNLYHQDHRDFGENRVQELLIKKPLLPNDIRWHFVGHLQTNKVKNLADFIHLIHSVDNLHLVSEINKQGKKIGKKINVLIQFKIATEISKYGLDPDQVESFFNASIWESFPFVEVNGVMGMASFVQDQDQIRQEFRKLKSLYDYVKNRYFQHKPTFRELSMGMSADYEIALEEGSTIVRIGTLIFGPRN